MIFRTKLVYWTFLLFLCQFHVFPQEMKFIEDGEGLLLLEGEQPRFFYQIVPKSKNGKFPRANYVHPLYGLDGEVLTEDFPDDHLHHHGIFWSWHQLYAEGRRIGDPWFSDGVTWEVEEINTKVDEKVAKLKSEILWVEILDKKPIIKENLIILFERINDDVFLLFFDIELTALVDGVKIGGSENAKGYGGFSARLLLPENVSFQSTTGKIEPNNLPVQAGSWMNLKGNFDPSSNLSSGIVIMGEPDKLPSFQGWILRSANSMQNMAFPGRIPLSIKRGESLEFRNQILVHRNLSTDEISQFYDSFIKRNKF